jgi:hypothetical protein
MAEAYNRFGLQPNSDASCFWRPFRELTGGTADQPAQENDANCGFACQAIVAANDYVFTAYPKR